MTDIFLEGGQALIGAEFVETSLLVSGTDIVEVDASRGRTPLAINARHLLVLPGIVDLHGDAFERQMMPRAGVDFPIDVALASPGGHAMSATESKPVTTRAELMERLRNSSRQEVVRRKSVV